MRARIYEDGEQNPDIVRIYKLALLDGKKLASHKNGNKYWIMYHNEYGGKTMICWLMTEEKK